MDGISKNHHQLHRRHHPHIAVAYLRGYVAARRRRQRDAGREGHGSGPEADLAGDESDAPTRAKRVGLAVRPDTHGGPRGNASHMQDLRFRREGGSEGGRKGHLVGFDADLREREREIKMSRVEENDTQT